MVHWIPRRYTNTTYLSCNHRLHYRDHVPGRLPFSSCTTTLQVHSSVTTGAAHAQWHSRSMARQFDHCFHSHSIGTYLSCDQPSTYTTGATHAQRHNGVYLSCDHCFYSHSIGAWPVFKFKLRPTRLSPTPRVTGATHAQWHWLSTRLFDHCFHLHSIGTHCRVFRLHHGCSSRSMARLLRCYNQPTHTR